MRIQQGRASFSVGSTATALLLLSIFNDVKASFEFRIENAMPAGNIMDLTLTSRLTVPYGPDLFPDDGNDPQSSTDQPYRGYGFGMGASESIQYDHVHKYLYSMSDIGGYIIVADYENPLQPTISNYSFQTVDPALGNLRICPETGLLVVSLEDLGELHVYSLVDRESPAVPTLLKAFGNVPNPKTVLISKDCSTIVVANENQSDEDELAQGSITFIQGLNKDVLQDDSAEFQQTTVSLDFDEWDDTYLLRRGLNMPLTHNSLEYWDEHSDLADDLDFTYARENYRSALFLEPANLAWNGPDESELLVNLQENNGLLRINMTDLRPVAVAGYGLKDHSTVPIDINVEDKDCDLKLYPSLFAMRNPDIIQTVKYNEKYYVVTANEGSSKDFGDWEEEIESQDLFKGNEFGLKNVVVPKYIFEPNNTDAGHSVLFNYDGCIAKFGEGEDAEDAAVEAGCLHEIVLSVGSNAIDFESDPTNPIFHRMVLFGGRGWSIYELPDNPDDLLKLIFDSGDAMEKEGCEQFPWSHNAVQEEDDAPVLGPNNTFYKYLIAEEEEEDAEGLQERNDPEEDGCVDQGDGTPGACPMPETVDDQSGEAGPSVENVILGEACGRLVAAVAAEKSSVAMLFDITDINSPDLLKVFHLSPVSQYKSVGLAYNAGELGEIDAESGVFLTKETSPSGNAGILWAGAKSGTVAFWEFQCKEESRPSTTNDDAAKAAGGGESSSTNALSSSSRTAAGLMGLSTMIMMWVV